MLTMRLAAARPADRDRSRGTVLLMFPAAVMIMVVLGSIVLDVGLSQVRARELQSVADSAANDTLAALDIAALRNDGTIRLDPAVATRVASRAVASGPLPGAIVRSVVIDTDRSGRITVDVTLQLRVDLIMAPALPGGIGSTTITRTGRIVVVD